MDILPIGSVIRYEEKYSLMIVGYASEKKPKKFIFFYDVIPYPIGLIDEDSIKIIPMDTNKIDVIFKGYATPVFEKYINNRFFYMESAMNMPIDQWNELEQGIMNMVEDKNAEE